MATTDDIANLEKEINVLRRRSDALKKEVDEMKAALAMNSDHKVNAPAKLTGDGKIAKAYRMSNTPCRFGEQCTNRKCGFLHVNNVVVNSDRMLNKPCRFGEQCTNRKCGFIHLEECPKTP